MITAHDAATGKELWRTRTIPRKGEPGDETLGRRADGAALARRHVDGAELRPRARPHLHRHVGHDSGAEVHLGRRRQAAPLSQLDARAGPGRRQDRLVLPASDRSLGPRSSVRAACSSTRPSRPIASEVAWINPRVAARRAAPRHDGHSRQDGHRLHARSRDRRVPLGAADGLSRTSSRTSTARRARSRSIPSACSRTKDQTLMVCPGTNGGKNWPAGAYSPRTNAMYMPMQNMCMNATIQSGERDPQLVYGFSSRVHRRAGRRTTSASSGRSRPRRARRCGSTSSASA